MLIGADRAEVGVRPLVQAGAQTASPGTRVGTRWHGNCAFVIAREPSSSPANRSSSGKLRLEYGGSAGFSMASVFTSGFLWAPGQTEMPGAPVTTKVRLDCWTLALTVSNTTVGTTTAVTANPTGPELTTGSVTYTATVTATSGTPTGTVAFTDTLPGGSAVTIAGCGSVALSSGQAVCVASITTEGNHTITANYSPTGSFGSSSGTILETYRHATTGLRTASSAIPGHLVSRALHRRSTRLI